MLYINILLYLPFTNNKQLNPQTGKNGEITLGARNIVSLNMSFVKM